MNNPHRNACSRQEAFPRHAHQSQVHGRSVMETLEGRRLLSASLSGGVLTVTTGSAADWIRVYDAGMAQQTIRVEESGPSGSYTDFAYADVTSIVVSAGDGADTIEIIGLDAKSVSVNGEGGNDTITGSTGNETLTGSTGNDTIYGRGGSDYIDGSAGHDLLFGGENSSSAADGDDYILGSDGYDTIWGEKGNDTLSGGDHHDEIHGGDGNDSLQGALDDDLLVGDNGDDTLYGGAGNDWMYGLLGLDRLYGNEGDDMLYGYDLARDARIWGGPGTDFAEYDSVWDSGTYDGSSILSSIENPYPR